MRLLTGHCGGCTGIPFEGQEPFLPAPTAPLVLLVSPAPLASLASLALKGFQLPSSSCTPLDPPPCTYAHSTCFPRPLLLSVSHTPLFPRIFLSPPPWSPSHCSIPSAQYLFVPFWPSPHPIQWPNPKASSSPSQMPPPPPMVPKRPKGSADTDMPPPPPLKKASPPPPAMCSARGNKC